MKRIEVRYWSRNPNPPPIYAFVDDDDFEWLSTFNWRWFYGYAAGSFGGRHRPPHPRDAELTGGSLLMHRIVTRCPKGMVVDHVSRNRLDNRKVNLRVCTQKENMQNVPKRGQR